MYPSAALILPAVALTGAAALAGCSTAALAPDSSASPEAATASGTTSGQLTVLAAASLQGAFTQLATEFEQASPGVKVTFDFQGSQDLVAALAEGSQADVLATASATTMKAAADKGLVGKQTEFATNALTLIVPAGNPAKVTGLDSSLDSADLVICAPAVPCGEATNKLASQLGVTLKPASEEQKVTDVRGKVESGQAEAGIVYTTDAAVAGKAVESIPLPANNVINHYPIAVTKNAADAQRAQAFIDLVMSARGQEVLQKAYGFGAPAAG